MKISIIMPTYNDRESIEETLDSVIEQTYSSWELIIVDDGSTDGTSKTIEEYTSKHNCKDKIKYIFQENQDQLNALMNGSKYIEGDYVYILHSDDLMPSKDFLQKVSEVISNNRDKDAFIGDLIIINNKSEETGIQKVDKYTNKKNVLPTLMLWLGRNLYSDVMIAKKEVFISSIKESYLTWNTPFWMVDGSDKRTLDIKNTEFPILKYRVHENNYINNDLGRLNVINGELRVVTRLMKDYSIPMYKIQFYLYRVFNKLGIKKIFSPIYFNKEECKKGDIVEFIVRKRFDHSYKENIFLNSLVNFYKLNNKRAIELPNISEDEKIYKGKDMRLFNKKLLNDDLSDLYTSIMNEMNEGFNEIIVKTDKQEEVAKDIVKFLCIYPHVKIRKV